MTDIVHVRRKAMDASMLVGQVVLACQRPVIEAHATVKSRPGVAIAPLRRLFIDREGGIVTAVCMFLQASQGTRWYSHFRSASQY
jgi:hypothetical protein